ncbi:right-handed parallel beta-helix repeat-containing protein [Arthrobacter sp. ISL-30]|uniref:right-handed parallel beta-helix repeat-containing protein n=1 Tax=Arthrobacter sp. ISL-30 TaxID=2819109 RepID=UPI001BE9A0E9|nr:right-handed parallel beta-helix repeat-containing protein [Arthrobacter sp. ISL-30]MBT2513286.1 right-handed parallel beta-helix repeat-containing protein [Arthrobacter sp. ISL-30]
MTGASAVSAIGANSAQANPGGKTPPNEYVPIAEKGAPSGVATLDLEAKIPPALIPDLSAAYAPVLADGKGLVRKGDLVFNVMDYGAAGNGLADDTAACQTAINALPEHATLIFPGRHYIPGNLSLNKKHITLAGPGTLLDGKVVIGTTGTREDQFWNVTGLTFERSTRGAASYGIELLKTRRGTIQNNVFLNMDKAIYVHPLPTAAAHDTAQVKIVKNEFADVNYAFYVDRADVANWMHTSDCKFLANTVNVAYITHVYAKSIDGLVCSDNVFFFPSYNTSDGAAKAAKKHNIYIGQSDWLVIKGNNCFESGEEAILLDMAKHFSISDNLIAWPGQKAPYDAVKFTGSNSPNGMITDNVISRFSGNAIGVHTSGNGTIVVKNNLCEYDAATGTYYGTPALNTFTHHGVYQPAASTDTLIESGNETTGGIYNVRKDSMFSAVRLNQDVAVAGSKSAVTVTAANTPIFSMQSTRGGTALFSGMLLIEVKNTESESGNLSSYLFHVTRHPLGASLTKVSEHGLLTGGSANHPSFTFTVDGTGKLFVSPVGATSGKFYFYATYQGNLRLMKP